MSQAKHTPGPWWATENGVRDSGGYIFHTNPVMRYPGQDERYAKEVAEREANKAAAAALPDLLEALKALKERLDACKGGICMSPTEVFDSFYQAVIDEVIRKAEGV